MKKKHFRSRIVMLLTCLAALCAATAWADFQENSGTAKKGDSNSKTAEERRPDEPQQPPIDLHITVSVDGLKLLPEDSWLELRGLNDCDNVTRRGRLNPDGQTTLSGVPTCKVMVKILITGLDAKIVSAVDLAPYRNAPMRIQVKSSGAPVVN
jgi:hypothetical protein